MGKWSNFARSLKNCDGGTIKVRIRELVELHGRKTIVVDGSNFYGHYLYPKFDWVCGSVKELVEEIRHFVEAFGRVGVKLVFFFVDGHLDEGADKLGTETWVKRHSDFVRYSNKFVRALSDSRKSFHELKQGRSFYQTPLDVQSVVIFALRHVLHCDVHLVYSGDRCDATAYFTRSNDCLALLAQDYIYMFYQGILCHLSLHHLNLDEMTTIQFCPDVLAREKHLVGIFYPTIYNIMFDCPPQLRAVLKTVRGKIEACESVAISRAKILESLRGKKIQEVFNIECEDLGENEKYLFDEFVTDILRFNYGFEYLTVHGPLEKWELIKLRAQELYTSGRLSSRIQNILITKSYFNNCILEDFDELPPSSLMYQPLRSKLYGVLFHEETEQANETMDISEQTSQENCDPAEDILQPGALPIMSRKLYGLRDNPKPHKGKEIHEWCMLKQGCSQKPFVVVPDLSNPALHPGLLTLWDFNNKDPDIQCMKWKLFANCISTRLNIELLQSLPPTLILPSVILYYMYNEVPDIFKTEHSRLLQPWEVEVFIALAVMMPHTSINSIQEVNIANINPRVVKLVASFVYGYHTMRLLVETCGWLISDYDLSLWHFFDGKLFHLFYSKAEWRRSAMHLCIGESCAEFQKIKEIVLPGIPKNSRRM